MAFHPWETNHVTQAYHLIQKERRLTVSAQNHVEAVGGKAFFIEARIAPGDSARAQSGGYAIENRVRSFGEENSRDQPPRLRKACANRLVKFSLKLIERGLDLGRGPTHLVNLCDPHFKIDVGLQRAENFVAGTKDAVGQADFCDNSWKTRYFLAGPERG